MTPPALMVRRPEPAPRIACGGHAGLLIPFTSEGVMEKSTEKQAAESFTDADCQEGNAEGRDALGRFTRGNVGGPGNPFARRVARLRQGLLDCVADEEMASTAGQLVVQGTLGAPPATKR